MTGWVRRVFLVPALLAALAPALPTVAADPDPAGSTPASSALWNGRNLDGWRSWLIDTGYADPRGVFRAAEGLLRISGDGLGYLGTLTEHENYRLVVEWRWGTTNTCWNNRIGRARDSGIFLHATGPDGNSEDGSGAFMAAIECNLFQGATGDLLLIRGRQADGSLIAPRLTAEIAPNPDRDGWFTWFPGGQPRTLERWGRLNWRGKSPDWTDTLDVRGPQDVERPPGEWNLLECEAFGDRLRIHLNGVLVNEARGLHPARGRILLQCEGSEIDFRRVDLIPRVSPPTGPGDGTTSADRR